MADYRSEWLRLPGSWSHGVTRDGRVFFIDEEAHTTTWLHPATGEAVISGHRKTADLPTGWEEGYTFEGARYYINLVWLLLCPRPQGTTKGRECSPIHWQTKPCKAASIIKDRMYPGQFSLPPSSFGKKIQKSEVMYQPTREQLLPCCRQTFEWTSLH